MKPLPDPNIVYAFHYYNPFIFTHQGFKWGPFEKVVGIPYPVSKNIMGALLDRYVPEQRSKLLEEYGQEDWNSSRIARDIANVVHWRNLHKVRVICNEFGVVRDTVPEADRARWLRDVRETLEAAGIGWAMWDYGGHFGLFAGTAPSAKPDPVTTAALGLRMPD
jgi:hypothetical protein